MKTQILSFLPADLPWTKSILWFDSIDSTNTYAKTLAAAGAPHGTVLIADTQTGGRGRMGRTFQSPSGAGIYLSVILRPNCSGNDLMHLTCAVAVAVCHAIESVTGLQPGIKWTNDLILSNRKLGGILTELSLNSQTGLVDYAIVGIGINCNQQLQDFSLELQNLATSLTMHSSNPINRAQLAAAMIVSLEQMSANLFTQKVAIMDNYQELCITIGQEISVLCGDEVRHGIALDLDENGGLLVRFDDGSSQIVTSGEVSIRGMYGYL